MSKTDDNPWFWTDSQCTALIQSLARDIGQDHPVLDLFRQTPDDLHGFVHKIPASNENQAQEIMMTLISWQSQVESTSMTEIEKLVFQLHPDWKEEIVVDPV
jgi:hypothetical protein